MPCTQQHPAGEASSSSLFRCGYNVGRPGRRTHAAVGGANGQGHSYGMEPGAAAWCLCSRLSKLPSHSIPQKGATDITTSIARRDAGSRMQEA